MNFNPTPAQSDADLIQAAIETLQQGELLLRNVDDDAYNSKVSVAFNASIGGHYRHCLDPFRAVLDSAMAGDSNYDDRARGALIEYDPVDALQAARELFVEYEQLEREILAAGWQSRTRRATARMNHRHPFRQWGAKSCIPSPMRCIIMRSSE